MVQISRGSDPLGFGLDENPTSLSAFALTLVFAPLVAGPLVFTVSDCGARFHVWCLNPFAIYNRTQIEGFEAFEINPCARTAFPFNTGAFSVNFDDFTLASVCVVAGDSFYLGSDSDFHFD